MNPDLKIIKSQEPTFLSKDDRVCNVIKKIVSNHFEVPYELYDSKSRKRDIIQIKQVATYFIRKTLRHKTFEYIGKIMKYDHATVMHCIKQVSNLCETDPSFRRAINQMSEKVDDFYNDLVKDEKNYIICINECVSLKINNDKSILLSGFKDCEVSEIIKQINLPNETLPVKHKNTGIFIIENTTNL